MPQRISLDAPSAPARKAIDANWSAKKKKVVAGLCIGLGTVAVAAGGMFAWSHRPVSLPKTREEAMRVMASDRYKNMDEDRQRQYAVVAAELFKDVPREEMRTYFEDEKTREVLFAMREEAMDEMILKVARGEPIEDMRMGWRPGGPGGPGGGRPEGGGPGDGQRREGGPEGGPGGPGGPGGAPMTDEQRQQRRADMARRISDRIGKAVNDGNAQMNGLRAEFMSRMRAQGGGPGGGGGGGPRGPG